MQANKAQLGGAERAIAGKNHRDPGSSGRANFFRKIFLIIRLFFPIIQFRRVYFGLWGFLAVKRYSEDLIFKDLQKKMVFIGGPRQVGKTTVAKNMCRDHFAGGQYFNWDVDEDRRAILNKNWLKDSPLIIFDELHKYPRWKQWLKGVFDSKTSNQEYLVTGSARLDVYRRGSDSLMGRYHYWRLHPFTLDEIPAHLTAEETYQRLLTLGGFP